MHQRQKKQIKNAGNFALFFFVLYINPFLVAYFPRVAPQSPDRSGPVQLAPHHLRIEAGDTQLSRHRLLNSTQPSDARWLLLFPVNCRTARVNIIVLSVVALPKTKPRRGRVKWGCRACIARHPSIIYADQASKCLSCLAVYDAEAPGKQIDVCIKASRGVNTVRPARRRWWNLGRQVLGKSLWL